MSDKKLPEYSWLNVKDKQQIKQFIRENPRNNLENTVIFAEIDCSHWRIAS